MKLLLLILLPVFCTAQLSNPMPGGIVPPRIQFKQSGSEESPKYDTVKCYIVIIENGNDTGHLIVQKAWAVRSYQFISYELIIDSGKKKITPLWSKNGVCVEFLAHNKFNTIVPVKDFKPIIQDWK